MISSLLLAGAFIDSSRSGGAPVAPSTIRLAACDRYAAPDGRRGATGSLDDPFAGPKALASSLRPLEVGCLRQGRYRLDEQLRIVEPLTTLQPAPGEEATIRGALRVEPSARGTRIQGLRLDGRNPQGDLGPLIYADRTVLRGNEITNSNAPLICVHVDRQRGAERPTGVRIVGNEIHHCGALPRTNFHHGIYLASSENAVVRANWIHNNADRGLQLYPNADGTRVVGNRIESNGQGLAFGGAGGKAADGSIIVGNVIRGSRAGYEIGSSYPPGNPVGESNRVSLNCVIGDQAFGGTAGYKAAGNVVLDDDAEDEGIVEGAQRRTCEMRGLHGPASRLR